MPRADEDQAPHARSCHRLHDPCRLHIQVARQVRVDDVLAADGWIELLLVQGIAFHDPGICGWIGELARITQQQRYCSFPHANRGRCA